MKYFAQYLDHLDDLRNENGFYFVLTASKVNNTMQVEWTEATLLSFRAKVLSRHSRKVDQSLLQLCSSIASELYSLVD